MTWVSLRKDKIALPGPERNTSVLSTTIHFMSVVMPDVYRSKCFIVCCVCNWNSQPSIRRAICSGLWPVLFAPMEKSARVTYSKTSFSSHLPYACARLYVLGSPFGILFTLGHRYNAECKCLLCPAVLSAASPGTGSWMTVLTSVIISFMVRKMYVARRPTTVARPDLCAAITEYRCVDTLRKE